VKVTWSHYFEILVEIDVLVNSFELKKFILNLPWLMMI